MNDVEVGIIGWEKRVRAGVSHAQQQGKERTTQEPKRDKRTFFIIPAFLLLNVICLLDLSPIYSILIFLLPGSPSLSRYVNPPG